MGEEETGIHCRCSDSRIVSANIRIARYQRIGYNLEDRYWECGIPNVSHFKSFGMAAEPFSSRRSPANRPALYPGTNKGRFVPVPWIDGNGSGDCGNYQFINAASPYTGVSF